MTPVRNGKADFIQGWGMEIDVGNTAMGVLIWRREIGLNSKYNNKSRIYNQEAGGGSSGRKITKHQGLVRILAKPI